MPAGRPAKPIDQHLAEGTYRPDRHQPHPDLPMLTKVTAPKWFDKNRRNALKQLVHFWTTARNILTAADVPMLIAFADYAGTWIEMAEHCAEHGHFETLVSESGTRQVQSAQSKLKDSAFASMQSIAKDFGMTPVDRARMFNAMRQAGSRAKDASKPPVKAKDW